MFGASANEFDAQIPAGDEARRNAKHLPLRVVCHLKGGADVVQALQSAVFVQTDEKPNALGTLHPTRHHTTALRQSHLFVPE